jgi:S-(hydroxymethyl)glutathione dehydrogenase/alcohol dehydrogenase
MRSIGGPLSVETLRLDEPRAGEVLLHMRAAGVCGSDRSVLSGHVPVSLTLVGGHERAGVVQAIGPGVERVRPADYVIQSFIASCGACRRCDRGYRTYCENAAIDFTEGRHPDGTYRMFDAGGDPIGMPQRLARFSEWTVTTERNCVVISADVASVAAAVFSFCVATGVGAALNVARVTPGDAVVVVGFGGVGAAAVVGAVAGGAAQLIVADVHEQKREMALDLGATGFVNTLAEDLHEAVHDATGGRGADSVLLTLDAARGEKFEQGIQLLGPGGVLVQVGLAHTSVEALPIAPRSLMSMQSAVVATPYGGMDRAQDAVRYIDMYRAGRLPVDRLVTKVYELDGIDDTFADMAAGRNIRGVVRYPESSNPR